MLLLVTWTVGVVVWIVLWAIGVKAIDAFMLTVVLLLSAAAVHVTWPHLPGNRRPTQPADNPPFN